MRKIILDLCLTGCDLKPQAGYLDSLVDNDISVVAVACANQGIEDHDHAPDDLGNYEFLQRPSQEIKKELEKLHEKKRAPLSADHQNSDDDFIPLVDLDRAVVIDDFEKILVPTDSGVPLFLACLRFDFNDAKSQLLLMSAGERERYMTASLEAAAISPGFQKNEFDEFFNQVFDDLNIDAATRHIPFLAASMESIAIDILMRRKKKLAEEDDDDAPVVPRRRSVERA